MRSTCLNQLARTGCFLAFACWSALAWSTLASAETPPEQQQAIDAIKKVRSNLQLNRDGTVRFVRFSKPVVTDQHLEVLPAFKQLDYLAIVTPTVTNHGIAHISSLSNLDTLVLSESSLTDTGMSSLVGLTRLEHLFLDRTPITSGGLSALSALERLQTLSLIDTCVDDAGLTILAGLPKLEALLLSGTKITSSGMSHLAGLRQLRILYLDDTELDDFAIEQIARLPALEEVSLCGTQVTLRGLRAFDKHPSLKRIKLRRTEVKREDFADSEEILPKVSLLLDPTPENRLSLWQRYLAGQPLRTAATENDVIAASRQASRNSGADFQKQVVPLLGRLGCNGRTCHGSFQGKGGFRLSMFGYDFAADHQALVGGESSRVNTKSPAESLILTYPTTEEHGGGVRFSAGGSEYQLLRDWISSGAPAASEPPQRLLRLEVLPSEIVFEEDSESVALQAYAVWEDGSRNEVTHLARFESNDDSVAEVSREGVVSSGVAGDTWIITSYDRAVSQTQVLRPVSANVDRRHSQPSPNIPESPIDRLIDEKLAKLNITPSTVCSDEAFLRRVSLDIAGSLPTAAQVREFVQDRSSDKRSRTIDELLETPAYVQWWSMWLSDLTGCNSQHLGSTDMNQPAAAQWNSWLLRRIRDNDGWDKIAAGLILAESRTPGQTYGDYAHTQSQFLRQRDPEDFSELANPMHYYWFRGNNQQAADRALSFGYIFLGVRLQCAQCHKHPFDQWSQQDFERFAEFFKRIGTGVSDNERETQNLLKKKLGVPTKLDTAALRRQMYLRVSKEGLPIPWNEIWTRPASAQPQLARLLGGPDLDLSNWEDPREPLVAWLLQSDNPYFAPAFVNRVWHRYFGTGIVEPPDDFNRANPPSNKPLLDWLATEFVRQDYNIKWLHRTIANSQAYQRDWRPNATNQTDSRNFSRAIVRRLPAEVTVDAIQQATVSDERSAAWCTDLAGRKIAYHPISLQAFRLDYSLLVFGKPLRGTNCDCERQTQPTLLQSLYVKNDREIWNWIDTPQGWVQAAHDAELDDRNAIESAYLRTVGRFPSESEIARAERHFTETGSVREGLRDLMWALINSREFLTNH